MRAIPMCDRWLLLVIAGVLSASFPNSACADELSATASDAAAQQSTVLFLNRPAAEVAAVLQGSAGDRQLSIVVDADANVLILRGQPEAVSAATQLVQVIDQPRKQVHLTVTIAVAGEGNDNRAPAPRVLDELKITTLDDNPAHLQFGQQVAVPSGATMAPPGRTVRTYTQQNVGTLIQVQPRIVPDGILLSLDVEKSWMESTPPGPSDESDANLPAQYTTYTTTLQSTLSLKEGQPQSVHAKVSGGSDSVRDVVMTVTATTGDPPSRETRSSGFGRPDGTRPPFGRGGFGSGIGGRSSGGFGGFRSRGSDSDRSPAPQGASSGRSFERLFEQIDENSDGKLSVTEWEGSRYNSPSFRSRGFQFSDDMTYETFQNEMTRVLGNARETDRGRSPRPQSDRPSQPREERREGQSDSGSAESTPSRPPATSGRP